MNKIVFSSWGGKIVDNRKGKSSKTPAGTITFPSLQSGGELKSLMGWNGMVITDPETDVVSLTVRYLNEIRKISCGECSVCMLGIDRLLELIGELAEGGEVKGILTEMEAVVKQVSVNSKCFFGQSAVIPVMDAIKYYKAEFQALGAGGKQNDGKDFAVTVTAPCQAACPASLDIPGYIELIRNNRFSDSLDLIRERCILPGIIGRACTHPCEEACVRNAIDEPLAIRLLKRAAADKVLSGEGDALESSGKPKEGKVAIVGAGPAGLSAAYRLRAKGYGVTIFEALPRGGGMIASGIPEYRVPDDILNHEVDLIKRTGVEIRYNSPMEHLDWKKLQKDGYKALFIAVGAHKGNKMGISGEETRCEGLVDGVEFLRDMNLGKRIEPKKKVIVIGGGNVALDCARSCVRLGFEDVEIIYRRSRAEMPASIEEIKGAEEEGIKISFLAAPVSITVSDGCFRSAECCRMKLGEPDESGRRRPVPVKNSEYTIEADMIISAIGQSPAIPVVNASQELGLTSWGTIKADSATLATTVSGVYAGGDCVTGAATLIEALDAGNRAAESIDAYLAGRDRSDDLSFSGVDVTKIRTDGYVPKEPAEKVDFLDIGKRTSNFEEVEGGFSVSEAINEAKRCLRCYRVTVWQK
ncbi:MAG: FAD-dependent oxidoreductase [Syntrophales bacterium]|jgi:NADPH-dependent glutamate synthase beta subunit-like oxidoreductase|nr:FAD-dependent oxidoreductase [Syntrophales bacterium]MDY0044434.1 FAD-dependent oxidoreductase [Syntrophales bacterium]